MILDIEKNGKKKTRAKKADSEEAKGAAKTEPFVNVDFPKNGEVLKPVHYAIRISAGWGQKTEISIDGSPWTACRQNSGYFWYDWTKIAPGEHKIVARVLTGDGKFLKSKSVKCKVK